MNRYKFLASVVLIVGIIGINHNLRAQNDYDVLRFSTTYHGGTARVIGMGGAFSALGSDISAVGINPAGLGLYRSSDANITFGYNINSTEASFLGEKTTDDYFGFEVNSAGMVLSFPNYDNYTSGLGRICTNMAISFSRVNSYNQNLSASGRSNNHTYLSSVPYFGQTIFDFFLGTDLIYKDASGEIRNDFDDHGVYQQSQIFELRQRGYVNDFNLAFGFNESNKLYYGFSVGLVSMSHDEDWWLAEVDDQYLTPFIDSFDYINKYRRRGFGVNLKAGLMYQIGTSTKVSLAVHTPTILNIDEDWDQILCTDYDNGYYYDSIALYALDYTVVTPTKLVVGASYLINNMVLLSADYEGTAFRAMRLMSNSGSYSDINQDIRDYYQWRHAVRFGAEVKLGFVSLRGGGFYYSSPLKSSAEEVTTYGYSAGLGFRSGNFYIDAAFQNMIQSSNIYIDGTHAMKVGIDNTRTNVIATVGFRF